MRIKRIITALVLTIFMITSSAYAIDISTAVYNSGTDTITIGGNIKGIYKTPDKVASPVSYSYDVYQDKWGVVSPKWDSGKIASVIELKYDDPSCPNGYIKVSNRATQNTAPALRIRDVLNAYGLGEYTISGKVKLVNPDPETATTATTVYAQFYKDFTNTSTTAIPTTVNKFNSTTEFYNGTTRYYDVNQSRESITSVGSTWKDFSFTLSLEDYGINSSNVHYDQLPDGVAGSATSAKNSSLIFTTASAEGGKNDIYLADVTITKSGATAPATVPVVISDGEGNPVYANEIAVTNGKFNAALQLKSGTTPTTDYTVKVYNPNSSAENKYDTQNITISSPTAYTSDGKTDYIIQFNVFDYINTRDINSLSIIATSYDADNKLVGSTIINDLSISQSTDIIQNISLKNGTTVKLFLLENTTNLIPLTGVQIMKQPSA